MRNIELLRSEGQSKNRGREADIGVARNGDAQARNLKVTLGEDSRKIKDYSEPCLYESDRISGDDDDKKCEGLQDVSLPNWCHHGPQPLATLAHMLPNPQVKAMGKESSMIEKMVNRCWALWHKFLHLHAYDRSNNLIIFFFFALNTAVLSQTKQK